MSFLTRAQQGPAASYRVRPIATESETAPTAADIDLTEHGSLPGPLLQRLDALADASRGPFNALIGEMSRDRSRNIDWWASAAASRNIHLSPLFHQCVQLALVRDLLEKGWRLRVRVDRPEMAASLCSAGDAIEIVVTGRLWQGICRLGRSVWGVGSCVFHGLSARVAARVTRSEGRPLPAEPLIAVETFVTRESLVDGRFKDRYFPQIEKALSEEDRRRLYYVPTFYRVRNYITLCRTLRRGAANFVFRDDFLTWADYGFAVGHWWRVGRLLGRSARFAGFQVGALVDADLRAGRFANSSFQALLLYRFWRQAADRGLKVARIVDWYEGAEIDHAVAAAVNWHSLDLRLVGFRTLASHLHLAVTPVPHEVEAGVVPRTMAVVGARVRREIETACPSLDVLPGQGFRYSSLPKRRPDRADGTRNILVLLPIYAAYLPLVRRLIEPARQEKRSNPVRWWVKRHPSMPPAEAEAAFGSPASAGFAFVEGDLYDWLARADVAIGTATNTLAEAVAAGVPTLCLAGGNRPTEIPIPSWVDRRLWRVCYDGAETRDTLAEMLALGDPAIDLEHLQDELLSPRVPQGARRLLVDEPR